MKSIAKWNDFINLLLPQTWLSLQFYIIFYVLQIKIMSLGRNKYPRKRGRNARTSEFFPSATLIRISHLEFEFSIFYIAHSATFPRKLSTC